MKEIFASTCLVTLTTVESILNCHEIPVRRHGAHTSALFGNAFPLMPVSLMVHDDDFDDAVRILRSEKFTPSCDASKPSFFKS